MITMAQCIWFISHYYFNKNTPKHRMFNCRLGQAFCNHFFGWINVDDKERRLFYEEDNNKSIETIKQYIIYEE